MINNLKISFLNMLEILEMILMMAKVIENGKMVKNMKVNLRWGKEMDKVSMLA